MVSPLGQTALLFAPSGVRAREASPNQPRRGCGGTMLPLVSYSFELAPIRLRPTGYAVTSAASFAIFLAKKMAEREGFEPSIPIRI